MKEHKFFDWSKKRRIEDVLFGVAAARGTITYEQLGCRVSHPRWRLAHYLGAISEDETEAGGPMWSALVVDKTSQHPEWEGFIPWAKKLHPEYDVMTDVEIWDREKTHCYQKAEQVTS